MKLTSNLDSYPVFPNWVFTGKLQLDQSIVNHLLLEIQNDDKGAPSTEAFQLSQLMGTVFFDTVKSHFRLSKQLQRIESCDPNFISISPGNSLPIRVNRHRWYQGAVFLQSAKGASDIYLDMLDAKLYATPPGVQEYLHTIQAQHLKVVYWPAHLPWALNKNNSDKDTVLFTTAFIIKR